MQVLSVCRVCYSLFYRDITTSVELEAPSCRLQCLLCGVGAKTGGARAAPILYLPTSCLAWPTAGSVRLLLGVVLFSDGAPGESNRVSKAVISYYFTNLAQEVWIDP